MNRAQCLVGADDDVLRGKARAQLAQQSVADLEGTLSESKEEVALWEAQAADSTQRAPS